VKSATGTTVLTIAAAALADLVADAERRYPHEAVGLLATVTGEPGDAPVTFVAPLPNHARRPAGGTFVPAVDYRRQVAALAAAGYAPAAVYHSHPDDTAAPSAADLRAVTTPGVEVIVAVSRLGAGTARAWWLSPGAPAIELGIHVVPDSER
jgi:proteasome lid subunit RPN8/RPN11